MSDTEAGTFVPVTPAAPGDSEVTDPAAAAAPVDRSPRPAVTPPPGGVPWVMMGVVAAVIGVTAVWQMLGVWAVAGAVVAVLVIVGAASKRRRGEQLLPPAGPAPASRRAFDPGPTRKTRGGGARRRAAPAPAPGGSRARPAAADRSKPSARPAAPGGAGRKAPPRRPAASPPARPRRRDTSKRQSKRQRRKDDARMAQARRRWRALVVTVASPLAVLVWAVEAADRWVSRPRPEPDPQEQEPDDAEEQPPPDQGGADPGPDPAVAPVPGPKVGRPSASTSRPPKGGSSPGVSVSPQINAAVEAIRDHLGGFTAHSAGEFVAYVSDLHLVLEELALALGQANGRLADDDPLDPRVIEHLDEVRAMLSPVAEHAREAGPLLRAVHEADLQRLENPRPGEQQWDVTQQ